MSSGHSAGYADVIEEKDLMKIGQCGKLLKKFKKLCGDSFNEVSMNIASGQLAFECSTIDEDVGEKIDNVYAELQTEFNKETGLTLEVGFHDSDDNGDRYDEVNGVYWDVNGMYVLSEAGKKFSKIVERKTFVQFG